MISPPHFTRRVHQRVWHLRPLSEQLLSQQINVITAIIRFPIYFYLSVCFYSTSNIEIRGGKAPNGCTAGPPFHRIHSRAFRQG